MFPISFGDHSLVNPSLGISSYSGCNCILSVESGRSVGGAWAHGCEGAPTMTSSSSPEERCTELFKYSDADTSDACAGQKGSFNEVTFTSLVVLKNT